jgi:NAD(P)-dependent dehydrogenase (short-subunit alcohol dehydrogenase family)
MTNTPLHLINSSIAGHYISSRHGFFAYNASKHALTVITEGLRRELLVAKSMIKTTVSAPFHYDVKATIDVL